jgi:hypothetical protein
MKNKLKVEVKNRKSVSITTKEYDPGYNNEGDYIEITEWTNGNGIDIEFSRTSIAGINLGGSTFIKLTYNELNAIKACCKIISK